ncbi:hypothetical protein V5O48_018105 [Marasmius crinis-equi]|uniref:Uncharacterized protein n=1 Tax=Marasmius crinis-equi TaxID=585013 RepID=A0ABR3EM54_9AGAR
MNTSPPPGDGPAERMRLVRLVNSNGPSSDAQPPVYTAQAALSTAGELSQDPVAPADAKPVNNAGPGTAASPPVAAGPVARPPPLAGWPPLAAGHVAQPPPAGGPPVAAGYAAQPPPPAGWLPVAAGYVAQPPPPPLVNAGIPHDTATLARAQYITLLELYDTLSNDHRRVYAEYERVRQLNHNFIRKLAYYYSVMHTAVDHLHRAGVYYSTDNDGLPLVDIRYYLDAVAQMHGF